METEKFDIDLCDDGTLDTVVQVRNNITGEYREFRYSQEFAADWRDENGVLDEKNFFEDVVYVDAVDEDWDGDDVPILFDPGPYERQTGFVVAVGTIHAGFIFKGPFETFDEAYEYARIWHNGHQCEICHTYRTEVQ